VTKNIAQSLKAHIQGGLTTLARCVEIVRRDGRSFHFTDHDRPIVVENHTYSPANSFAGTSITSPIDIEVDAATIRGILNSGDVSRDDVGSGLFDFAEARFFIVNWNNPLMGKIVLRTGWLGEAVLNEDNTFTVELRGLGQAYATRIGKLYSPTCRADLGDRKCKFPLRPRRWTANTNYGPGDSVLIQAVVPVNYVDLPLNNTSWEDDGQSSNLRDPTGWTTFGDTHATWGTFSNWSSLTSAVDGVYFLVGTETITGITEIGAYQDCDLVAAGLSTGTLDTGKCRLFSSIYFGSLEDSSRMRLRVLTMDSTGASPQLLYDTGLRAVPTFTFKQVSFSDINIPVGTRFLRFEIFGTKLSNIVKGPCFDGLRAVINLPTGTFASESSGGTALVAVNGGTSGTVEPDLSNAVQVPDYDAYGALYPDLQAEWDRIESSGGDPRFATSTDYYEWHWFNFGQGEGRTLPTKLAGIANDGSMLWSFVARSGVVVGLVTSVANNQQFTSSSVTKSTGYYDGGLLYWETGANAGRTMEVKQQVGSTVFTFLRAYRPPQIGDRFALYPGCDKTITTCRDKFQNAVNFRGEPFVPGQDQYNLTPNADGGFNYNVSTATSSTDTPTTSNDGNLL
jgi:hypothetical protein